MATINQIENIPYPWAVNTTRRSLPLTNQKLWDMAKLITDRQRKAKELSNDKVYWDLLEEEWFDWLEDELFGELTDSVPNIEENNNTERY